MAEREETIKGLTSKLMLLETSCATAKRDLTKLRLENL